MKKNIDLALPGYPEGVLASVKDSPSEPDYPTVHLEGYDNLDLPESGSITFKYRQKRESTTKEKGGKVRYECTLTLTALTGVDGKSGPTPPAKSGSEAGDALDKLAKEQADNQDEGY